MSRNHTKPVCPATQEAIKKDYEVKLLDRCPVCAAIDSSCTAIVGAHPSISSSSSSHKSPHRAVIQGSGLSKEEKAELIDLCSEKINWGNAEAIVALPNTNALTDVLRSHLKFLRKKCKPPQFSPVQQRVISVIEKAMEEDSMEYPLSTQAKMKDNMVERNHLRTGDDKNVYCDICNSKFTMPQRPKFRPFSLSFQSLKLAMQLEATPLGRAAGATKIGAAMADVHRHYEESSVDSCSNVERISPLMAPFSQCW